MHKLQTMDYKQIIAAAIAGAAAGRLGALQPRLAPVRGRPLAAGASVRSRATELSRDVPLIIGTNKDEWTLFMAMDPLFGKMTEEQARERFAAHAGRSAARRPSTSIAARARTIRRPIG